VSASPNGAGPVPRQARVLRAAGLASGVVGIAGMIVTSIRGSVDGALAFGLVCAGGALVLLVLGAVRPPRGEIDPLRAAALEDQIADLVAAGTDEAALRRIVRLARGLER